MNYERFQITFEHFQTILDDWAHGEYGPPEDLLVTRFTDKRIMTLQEVLQELPQEERESSGEVWTSARQPLQVAKMWRYIPVVLDVLPDQEQAYAFCTHELILLNHQQEEAFLQAKHRLEEQHRLARYFVCEFAQNSQGELFVSHVMTLEGYTNREQAEKAASYDEQKMYHLGKYDVVMQARLAASYVDAQQGKFLDE